MIGIDLTVHLLQCSVLLPVVLTLIATQLNGSKFVKDLANFCYPKWALEAFVIANAERYATIPFNVPSRGCLVGNFSMGMIV